MGRGAGEAALRAAAERSAGGSPRVGGAGVFPLPRLPHETAALIIAELAANAALHGRVPGRNFRLTLSVTGNTLRIEVRDPRVERLPTVRPAPGPEAPRECGHGLLLVEELADRWGVVPELIGKTVWAELDGTPCTGLTGTKRDSRRPTGGTYGRGGR
ncbi:ATP-binding protein [Streptomyces antimycoticus]|uniref:ATP-binding protein n=1 Tax=Streptomyces antimycoticus TaxID=68175 RepID=UPI0025704543|nr:ATP-binding protein [Streptomyces antimycoticus]WJD98991.1 ATP-binding protein [Streptomyces antimycoticus]